ncbi:hypothetical protein DFH94DRAFT_685330 [Russula ochroleuca]|jgi:hypothetical protein|uniref:Uncharacterized protein n=1 Tax=Russula ochroleuca TaxID=152965 RepID=A0A9P5MLY9_9AGAM|nr:hypothetical protein DFH94DRAFT_685330 [Russula ochroleuca]
MVHFFSLSSGPLPRLYIGTPIADMLAHSPLLPLIVDYVDDNRDVSAEDGEGILLALLRCHRVRRVRLRTPVPKPQKSIMVMDEEYPVLEYLILVPTEDSAALILPERLQAPHLRHLVLEGFAIPIGPRLLTTAVDLVMLVIVAPYPSTYFEPNILLQWLSFMPQLEKLLITILFSVPDHDVEMQHMHTPIMTQVALPDLRWFVFRGVSAYIEAVVRRITAPRLEILGIRFFKQLTFSVPCLLQFMNTIQNFRFNSAKFVFARDDVHEEVHPREELEMHVFQIHVDCWHLDWQVSSMAQIFNMLSQIFSAVEHLALEHEVYSPSSEEHNEVDRTELRKLLRSFKTVNNLHVDDALVKELARSLLPEDGELPPELLLELQEVAYSGNDDTGDAFTSFIDARQSAGRPVTLIRLE